MVVVGAFILPHGAMVLDPQKEDLPEEAVQLYHGMVDAALEIGSKYPDLIFLTTPHSIALSNDFAIYLNKGGVGSAEWLDEYKEYSVAVEFDQQKAEELLNKLRNKKAAVTGLTAFTTGVEAPFRWGEAVPLWFLRKLPSKPKYILMSQPMRRYDQALSMTEEVLALGKNIFEFLDNLEEKVVIIISADLGHTHEKEGPYGHNKAAKEFDSIIEEWAESLEKKLLTEKAAKVLKEAMVCGYIGFLLLQGMLENQGFEKQVMNCSAPTYYGMMIAKYLK